MRYWLYILIFVLCVASTQAQTTKVIELPVLDIYSARLHDNTVGLNVDQIDSNTLKQYQHSTLAEILAKQSSIYIKHYGDGSLATVSFRGTAAQHTGIYWNGFNINPPSAGVMDLSLVPVSLFESINVQHGGASSTFGSGIIGGSIHLNNYNSYKKKSVLEFGVSVGSYTNYAGHAKALFSNSKYYSSTALYWHNAVNDFDYKNNTLFKKPTEKLAHAMLSQYGLMQEVGRNFSDKQFLDFCLWAQNTDRQIPPTMTMSASTAEQTDQSVRSSLRWKKLIYQGELLARAAYLQDFIHYTDEQSSTDSRILSQTADVEFELKKYVTQKLKLNVGTNYAYTLADIDAYQGNKHQQQGGVFVSLIRDFSKLNWSAAFNLRQEFIEGYQVPFSPSIGVEGKLWKFIYTKINVSKNFRAPTLNDRFWQPGGNENLKTETSWNEEASLIFRGSAKNISNEFTATVFNSIVDNWIIWLPQGVLWSPENIQEVWSRGAEAKENIIYNYNKFTFRFTTSYSYTQSTNQKKTSVSDDAYHKQLIYVPYHNAYAQLRVLYGGYELGYNQTYTSKRFILSDNSLWLDSYSVGQLFFSKKINIKRTNLTVQCEIDNLFNATYQVIEYRPMPGRNYKVTLLFNIK